MGFTDEAAESAAGRPFMKFNKEAQLREGAAARRR